MRNMLLSEERSALDRSMATLITIHMFFLISRTVKKGPRLKSNGFEALIIIINNLLFSSEMRKSYLR